MKVIPFKQKRRPPAKRRYVITPMPAVLTLVAVCALGWVALDGYMPETETSASRETSTPGQAGTVTASFGMCGRDRYTCVVDGDTIWYQGENLRLQSYDTPEPYTGICGGDAEWHWRSGRALACCKC